MALTTRTFKGHLAVDSADGIVEVWLVVKPHWREARHSVSHFVRPDRFICHFFYRANTSVTKHVKLDERPDRNELLLVDGALVVSETQLESLFKAGHFVRLPRAKVLSFAQFCRVVAAKARVAIGTMTVAEFYDQLQLCMLADHADVVMNNSITIYFWRKSFAHPYLTSSSTKYQGVTIPDTDWPLAAFRSVDSKPPVQKKQLSKSKSSSDPVKAVNDKNSSTSTKRQEVKEQALLASSTARVPSQKAAKVKTQSKEPVEKEKPKSSERKRSGSRSIQTSPPKRRHISTQTQIVKGRKLVHRSTQTTAVGGDSPLKVFTPIAPASSSIQPNPQPITATLFLSHVSYLSSLQTNVSTPIHFPPFPLSTPWPVVGKKSMVNDCPSNLLKAEDEDIHNGDVEVAAPEMVINTLGDHLAPLPSAS